MTEKKNYLISKLLIFFLPQRFLQGEMEAHGHIKQSPSSPVSRETVLSLSSGPVSDLWWARPESSSGALSNQLRIDSAVAPLPTKICWLPGPLAILFCTQLFNSCHLGFQSQPALGLTGSHYSGWPMQVHHLYRMSVIDSVCLGDQ